MRKYTKKRKDGEEVMRVKSYGPIETGYDPMNPEQVDEDEITLPGFD